MLLDTYQDLLLSTVHKAGEAIMEIYQDPSRFNIELKGDESPLTAADQKANAIICAALEGFDPGILIISEENKQLPFAQRVAAKRCWMVDPLDGTKEFIKRNGEFTVNIALIEDGRSVLGVVYVPVTGQTFFGARDEGAYSWMDGHRTKIAADSFRRDATGLRVVCSRSHLNEATKTYLEQYQDYELVPQGSSLKFTILAQGGADLYPRLGPTMEWDTAAAQIILEEAGGSLLEFDSRKPLRYNKENLRNPNFVAMARGEVY